MSGRYGRTELYLSRLAWQQQLNSLCFVTSICCAAEMVGILANQPVAKLSPLHLYHFWMQNTGTFGVCAEHLWPSSLTYGPTQWLDGVTDYNQTRRFTGDAYGQGIAPDPVCEADAVNHMILGFTSIDGTKAGYMAAIDAGLAGVIAAGYQHEQVAWDYNDQGPIGLDPRGQTSDPVQHSWADVGRVGLMVQAVRFTGIATAHRINPFMPNNNASLMQALRGKCTQMGPSGAGVLSKVNSMATITAENIAQLWLYVDIMIASVADKAYVASMANALVADGPVVIIQPQGGPNVSILTDIIAKAQAGVAANGVLTQAEADAIRSLAAQLQPTGGTQGRPADWQVPPAASGTDAQGHVWSLGAASPAGKWVLRDGATYFSGQATLLDYRGGMVKVQNSAGAWYKAIDASPGWVGTAAP